MTTLYQIRGRCAAEARCRDITTGGREPTGSDLIATVGFPCHSGATLSIRRLPSFKRAVGDTTDQATAPIWKIYPATSHAEQYIINSRYCGNLLW